MRNRLRTILTCVFLGMAMFSTASAEQRTARDIHGHPYILDIDSGYGYMVNDDDTLTLVKDGNHYRDSIIVVPEVIDGKSVTVLHELIYSQSDAERITVPEGIHVIDKVAFRDCRYLKNVDLPDTLTMIGDHAFSQNAQLQEINIPVSVESMGMNPFSLCYSLTTINISPSHPVYTLLGGILFDKDIERLIWIPTSYEENSYYIPEGVKTIDDEAFFYVCGLSYVYIPDSVSIIGKNAFRICYGLQEIEGMAGLKKIDDCAFMECPMKKMIFQDGLEEIGAEAFFGCQRLQYVKLPSSVTKIGYAAFDYCAENLILIVSENSYAEKYAIKHGIKYSYTDIDDFEYLEPEWIGG